MSTFRVNKTTNYTVMSNYHLKDKRLSLKAKGLLSWMLSNTDDWDYSLAGIVACCKEGETTVNTALRELQEYGYVQIIKCKPDTTNNRIHYDYNVYEIPQGVDSLGVESLGLESQGVENRGEINTNIKNTKKTNTNKNINSPEFKFGVKPVKTNLTLWDKCINLINGFTNNGKERELLIKALNLFLENSRESGTPFYSNHFKGKLNTLQKLSSHIDIKCEIIQQTLDNGWNNFYSLNTNKNKKKTNFGEQYGVSSDNVDPVETEKAGKELEISGKRRYF